MNLKSTGIGQHKRPTHRCKVACWTDEGPVELKYIHFYHKPKKKNALFARKIHNNWEKKISEDNGYFNFSAYNKILDKSNLKALADNN